MAVTPCGENACVLTSSTVNEPRWQAARRASSMRSGWLSRCGSRTQSSAITCLPSALFIDLGGPPCAEGFEPQHPRASRSLREWLHKTAGGGPAFTSSRELASRGPENLANCWGGFKRKSPTGRTSSEW